jgi:hypothetical protein
MIFGTHIFADERGLQKNKIKGSLARVCEETTGNKILQEHLMLPL